MRLIKHAVVVLMTLIAAAVAVCALAVLPNRLAFNVGESYTFYVGNTSKDCRVVTCEADKASVTRLTLSGVCGESTTFSSIDLSEFLESVDGTVIFIEKLSDSINYYCQAKLPYSVNLLGTEINLHICVKESGITVGTPIIFGGY